MKRDARAFSDLIRTVNIQSIRLLALNTQTAPTIPPFQSNDAQIRINWRHRVGEVEGTQFIVHAEIEASVVPSKDSKEAFFSLVAAYELVYAVSSGFRASKTVLDAFAGTNGIFNVWPYWRELVQSVSVRMQLPPVLLPVFRLLGNLPNEGKTPVRAGKRKRPSAKASVRHSKKARIVGQR